MGLQQEARAEMVEVLRLSPLFSLEAGRQRLPYKDQAELERLLDGVRKALATLRVRDIFETVAYSALAIQAA